MDDVHLANYIAGSEKGPVEVWRADKAIGALLEVSLGTPVMLSDYNYTKIKFGHPEITFEDYLKIPRFLSSGFVVPGRQKRSAEIHALEANPTYSRGWRLSLKATSKNEVFVTTFHRVDRKELRRAYNKAKRNGRLVRPLSNEMARHFLGRASRA